MLTISPVRTVSYYTNLAAEDYYLGAGEPPGEWYGLGTRSLGLYGNTVEKADIEALINGGAPSGASLVQNAYSEKRRLGWDCTFSAPKSVSLIWARADDNLRSKIQTAQSQAAKRGIDALERYAAFTRRGKAGETLERTTGLVAATFSHCTSREQDPQLHTHAVICNVAPRADDSWGSVESRKIYQWQKAAGALYRAELAAQMKQLGFQVERDEDSFHVSGVDKKLCEHFSKRSKSIREELKKQGVDSSASKVGDLIKLDTRKDKGLVDHQALLKSWQSEMDGMGFHTETLHSIQTEILCDAELPEDDQILYSITDKKATFKPQDLFYQTAIQSVQRGINAAECEQNVKRLIRDQEVVELSAENPFEPQYTTQSVLNCERMMIQTARDLSSRFTKSLTEPEIQRALKKAESELGFPFDDEQIEAIYNALNGPDISIVQGSAGAGKTTLMLAARHAYNEKGYKVLGASIAKKAADNLQEETGIQSVTVASLINKITNGINPLSSTGVLVVDEAGQLPSTDLQKLTHCAHQAQCKLILTGEDKQLDAINRGGALRYLSNPEVIGTQRIENIRRQRTAWARGVVADLRDGKAEQALKTLDEKGCLHFHENAENTKKALVDGWHKYQNANPEKASLVIAQRWSDVQEISKAIRDIHILEGRVGQENIPLSCSVADKSFKTEFSKGDRIKFCRNDYRKLGVSNGTLGTIESIRIVESADVEFSIRADDGRKVSFLSSEYADDKGTHLCHSYALTVYSSQGTTIDGNTFVYFTKEMNRANIYVAASRHKDESHIFYNRYEIEELFPDSNIAGKREEMLVSMMSKEKISRLSIEKIAIDNYIEL
ncbi:MobF family relaxase [Marinomonas transparens]|uniref:Relaxase domain-containing protein n=1 Tax=Marinomonas transparens TaxID=2795388 RepID=A0A934JUB6_9GAMM|nr:MobF family relaxase [Marinomonas transparens]MBJ7537192.1 relaxase domain-containing protein [Marinomonas transparens]